MPWKNGRNEKNLPISVLNTTTEHSTVAPEWPLGARASWAIYRSIFSTVIDFPLSISGVLVFGPRTRSHRRRIWPRGPRSRTPCVIFRRRVDSTECTVGNPSTAEPPLSERMISTHLTGSMLTTVERFFLHRERTVYFVRR